VAATVPAGEAVAPLGVAIVLGIGAAINPINSSLVVTSFADIAREFGIAFADVSVLMTYYLAFTAALYPIAGAVGDRLGRKRVFLLGIAGFGVVSLAASMAPDFRVLLVCRCLQAVFSAALMPNASALLRELVPRQRLAGALGVMSAIVGTATALGFPLGGLVGQAVGWRPLFWINVPLALVAAVAAVALLPASRPQRAGLSLAALFGAPLLPLALGANFLLRPDQHSAALAGLLLLAGAAIIGALLLALYRSGPLRREAASFGNRGFGAALALAALYSVVMYTVFLVLPAWLADGLGLGKRSAGLVLGLITVALAFGAPAAGRLIDRLGARPCLLAGVAMMALALSILRGLEHASGPLITLAAVLLGLGFTAVGNASQYTALQWVPPEVTAMAMGLYTCGRYLGGLLGTTAVAWALGVDPQLDLAAGQAILTLLLGAAVAPLLLVALLLPRPQPLRAAAP